MGVAPSSFFPASQTGHRPAKRLRKKTTVITEEVIPVDVDNATDQLLDDPPGLEGTSADDWESAGLEHGPDEESDLD